MASKNNGAAPGTENAAPEPPFAVQVHLEELAVDGRIKCLYRPARSLVTILCSKRESSLDVFLCEQRLLPHFAEKILRFRRPHYMVFTLVVDLVLRLSMDAVTWYLPMDFTISS